MRRRLQCAQLAGGRRISHHPVAGTSPARGLILSAPKSEKPPRMVVPAWGRPNRYAAYETRASVAYLGPGRTRRGSDRCSRVLHRDGSKSLRRLFGVVLLAVLALVFCDPTLAQTTPDGASREDPECVEFGGQYNPCTGQYEAGGVCGTFDVAERAADDALKTSRTLHEEPEGEYRARRRRPGRDLGSCSLHRRGASLLRR